MVKYVPVYRSGPEDRDVIIVGRDLSKMVDGDTFPLQKGQTMYNIGTRTTPRGKTLAVFSLNKTDKVARYFTSSAPAEPSAVIVCPHCGTKIPIR